MRIPDLDLATIKELNLFCRTLTGLNFYQFFGIIDLKPRKEQKNSIFSFRVSIFFFYKEDFG